MTERRSAESATWASGGLYALYARRADRRDKPGGSLVASLRSLCGVLLLAATSFAEAPETAKEQIRRALEAWPKAVNAKDKQGTYSLFAADLVASFPGQPDRDYEAMCKHLAASLDHPTKTFRYDAPDIKEIIVSGDLAVVRLIWTLHVIDQKTKDEVIAREIGVDVFKRQKDGSWRISISHAFPDEGDRKK